MKQVDSKFMNELTRKMYSGIPHYEAMARLQKDAHPNNAFVKMRDGKNYSLMEKYYNIIMK